MFGQHDPDHEARQVPDTQRSFGSGTKGRNGSRLCKNYFLATDTEYCFMKLASAEIMIHPRHLPNSIIARKVSASKFSHSLSHKRTLALPEAVGHRTNVGQEPGKPVYHAPQSPRK